MVGPSMLAMVAARAPNDLREQAGRGCGVKYVRIILRLDREISLAIVPVLVCLLFV